MLWFAAPCGVQAPPGLSIKSSLFAPQQFSPVPEHHYHFFTRRGSDPNQFFLHSQSTQSRWRQICISAYTLCITAVDLPVPIHHSSVSHFRFSVNSRSNWTILPAMTWNRIYLCNFAAQCLRWYSSFHFSADFRYNMPCFVPVVRRVTSGSWSCWSKTDVCANRWSFDAWVTPGVAPDIYQVLPRGYVSGHVGPGRGDNLQVNPRRFLKSFRILELRQAVRWYSSFHVCADFRYCLPRFVLENPAYRE